jgi:protocatechuate 4,5-dioxygenase, beta chain
VIYNDHMDGFFLDAYPTFALGMAEEYPIADEGFGARPFPPVPGDASFSWHIARALVADEFDLTMCMELEVDHGVISPLPMVDFSEGDEGWKIPIVPLAVNVILHPLPSPARCFRLGQALRRAVLSYPEDLSVVVVGTGGLSHQLTGPRFGRVTPDWDKEFMRLLTEDPEQLAELTHEELIKRGGTESVEVVLWLAMRGALPKDARPVVEAYYAHRIMGYGLQAYEAAA